MPGLLRKDRTPTKSVCSHFESNICNQTNKVIFGETLISALLITVTQSINVIPMQHPKLDMKAVEICYFLLESWILEAECHQMKAVCTYKLSVFSFSPHFQNNPHLCFKISSEIFQIDVTFAFTPKFHNFLCLIFMRFFQEKSLNVSLKPSKSKQKRKSSYSESDKIIFFFFLFPRQLLKE